MSNAHFKSAKRKYVFRPWQCLIWMCRMMASTTAITSNLPPICIKPVPASRKNRHRCNHSESWTAAISEDWLIGRKLFNFLTTFGPLLRKGQMWRVLQKLAVSSTARPRFTKARRKSLDSTHCALTVLSGWLMLFFLGFTKDKAEFSSARSYKARFEAVV